MFQRPPMEQQRRKSLPTFKKVEFSAMSEVCVVDNKHRDYDQSSSSVNEKWYTPGDMQSFKDERVCDLLALREEAAFKKQQQSVGASTPTPPSSFCPVGLEQFLSARGYASARAARKLTIQVVLDFQERQRASGMEKMDYTEQLACLSMRQTVESAGKALKRGKFQEMAKFME